MNDTGEQATQSAAASVRPATEAPGPKDRIGYESISLDCDRYEAHVEGRLVRLTRLEFDLLEFLARHPGCVVSYPDLTRHVLGRTVGDGVSVIRVHLSHLRKKLGHAAGLLRTVRGRGLLFDLHLDRRPRS